MELNGPVIVLFCVVKSWMVQSLLFKFWKYLELMETAMYAKQTESTYSVSNIQSSFVRDLHYFELVGL